MKKTAVLLYLLIFILLLSSCAAKPRSEYPFEIRRENTLTMQEDDLIVLTAQNGSLTSSGMTYWMQNNSNQTVYFGSPYYIQYRHEGTWYSFTDETDWTMELSLLDAKAIQSYSVDWSFLYGSLPAGQYRFIKPCFFQPGAEDLYYCFEFTVS